MAPAQILMTATHKRYIKYAFLQKYSIMLCFCSKNLQMPIIFTTFAPIYYFIIIIL